MVVFLGSDERMQITAMVDINIHHRRCCEQRRGNPVGPHRSLEEKTKEEHVCNFTSECVYVQEQFSFFIGVVKYPSTIIKRLDLPTKKRRYLGAFKNWRTVTTRSSSVTSRW
jgi:hypothetical protein